MTTKQEVKATYYPVIWVQGKWLFEGEGTRRLGRDWLGLCGYSKRIFIISPNNDILTRLVVTNVLVGSTCEEEKRCLDFDCPYNHTIKDDFAKAFNLTPSKLPKDFGVTMSVNKNPDGGLHSFGEYFERYGNGKGGILLPKVQAKKRRL